MFATHYHQLTDEFQDDSAVRRMHMKAVVDRFFKLICLNYVYVFYNLFLLVFIFIISVRKRVTFLYKIVDGVCPKSYGVN